ncbi:hypothetical protein [Nitrosomonas ureae]|uniref:Uncharacterized protein n=1 Tax=Nitrosomonas ureae TaxID=44577 RepID=A0A1H2ERL8_9PROT|nr:hypothetical protein [Nitrosomonas ureae]ALQ51867.1 hypothetical protein ATY38_11960 [Nitrosomonas ureae]SDT97378.1 hypothetical protein SAMN05216406_11480 [Nitrosomonas ureae]
MSWYTSTLAWIDEQRLKNPDMALEELKNHSSKKYPFHGRYGSAYKGFLKAMRERFGYTKRNDYQKDIFNEES